MNKDFLDRRSIDIVAFDLDNTLLKTGDYYRDNWQKAFNFLVSLKRYPSLEGKTADDFLDTLVENYFARDKKPMTFVDEIINGIESFADERVDNDIAEMVHKEFEDFYTISPTPYPYTKDLLKNLDDYGKRIVLCSHAQDEWTKAKAEMLSKNLSSPIPYFAVDISEEKNSQSWIDALNIVKERDDDIERTLVVGDNFDADIMPAVEAGFKYLIWIDKYNSNSLDGFERPRDVELFRIKDLGELKEFSF